MPLLHLKHLACLPTQLGRYVDTAHRLDSCDDHRSTCNERAVPGRTETGSRQISSSGRAIYIGGFAGTLSVGTFAHSGRWVQREMKCA